ncbi:MAG TPA: cation:proton antiporter, partial [Tepidiformaceae bacterium]|nr:cation:proton antiporter [Tepidiformaceae bacterium]
LAGGLLARVARLPPIVGYLVAGVVISPFTPGYVVDTGTVQSLAELGVIFLMFGVGLNFDIAELLRVKGIVIPGALVQVAATTAIGTGIGVAFGLPMREGVVLGLAISVASTVVLVRAFADRGLLNSIHGRTAVGWLIVEDLATVMFLVILPALDPTSSGNFFTDTGIALAKAAGFLAIVVLLGVRLVPWVLGLIARTGSRELFILSVLAAALGTAAVAPAFGLSVALGAFAAGVLIGETETSHQAAADVLPFREAFAVLFFVSIGMVLDPGVVWHHFGLFAAVLAAVLIGKSLFAFTLLSALPAGGRTGLLVAAGLTQIGEFSFIVAQEAMGRHLMDATVYNVILAVSVVSITLNPLSYRAAARLEPIIKRLGGMWAIVDRQGGVPEIGDVPESAVIIAGYGRVGELTGHALAQLGIPFVVIEANIALVRRLRAAGISAVWGDAASVDVLAKAGIEHARALILAVPDESTELLAMANARNVSRSLPIVVRAPRPDQIELFRGMGATEVVVPAHEGGLEIMRQALIVLGFDSEEALHYSHAVRDTLYEQSARAAT